MQVTQSSVRYAEASMCVSFLQWDLSMVSKRVVELEEQNIRLVADREEFSEQLKSAQQQNEEQQQQIQQLQELLFLAQVDQVGETCLCTMASWCQACPDARKLAGARALACRLWQLLSAKHMLLTSWLASIVTSQAYWVAANKTCIAAATSISSLNTTVLCELRCCFCVTLSFHLAGRSQYGWQACGGTGDQDSAGRVRHGQRNGKQPPAAWPGSGAAKPGARSAS